MKARDRGAARRYARALLDVALAQGEDAAVAQGLRDAVLVLAGHPELQKLLSNPAVAGDRKRALVAAIWKRAGSALLQRLLELLASRERMELLPEVAQAYVAAWNAQRGVVTAEVLTAEGLDAAQSQRLAAALGRVTGRTVELQAQLDPSLLGGVLVRMEGRVYDASVRGRLRSLRRHLLGREVA